MCDNWEYAISASVPQLQLCSSHHTQSCVTIRKTQLFRTILYTSVSSTLWPQVKRCGSCYLPNRLTKHHFNMLQMIPFQNYQDLGECISVCVYVCVCVCVSLSLSLSLSAPPPPPSLSVTHLPSALSLCYSHLSSIVFIVFVGFFACQSVLLSRIHLSRYISFTLMDLCVCVCDFPSHLLVFGIWNLISVLCVFCHLYLVFLFSVSFVCFFFCQSSHLCFSEILV